MEYWRARIFRMWFVVIGAAIWVSILATEVQAEPAGFVSIDCGASAVYFDTALNITWDTDEKYTSDGENAVSDQGNVTFVYNPVPGRALNTVRRFAGPRNRSCYALPAAPNTTYLVRAAFLPWQTNPVVKFDVLLEGTTVKTVDAGKGDVVEVALVTAAAATIVHLCLLRTSPLLNPYISTLELRPLDGGMYETTTRQQGFVLSLLDRHNFGVDAAVSPYLRYPDDPYDRIWLNWVGDFDPVNTTHSIDTSRVPNKPPAVVMATARRLIGYQIVQWQEDVTYYIAMYFAELNATVTRPFSVDLDTTPWLVDFDIANVSGGPFIALQEDKTYTAVGALGNFTFTPAVGANDKPVLNAIEIYQVFANPLPFVPDGATPGPGPASSGVLVPAIAGASVGAVVLLCIVVLFLFIRRRRRNANASSTLQGKQSDKLEQSFQVHTIKFSLRELQAASNGFVQKIGEGGFGPVYYGQLKSGREIAIKVSSETSKQGDVEFRNEVDLLSRIHHKSLVSLIGYCQEKNQMLVYEYMRNGTLRDHLYGQMASKAALNWSTRIHLALDAAQGLEYLHMACSPNIIHRDVKTSNILLTAGMEAKVSDFGLSKLAMQEGATHVSTMVKGTAGYLDPEYYTSNKLTVKSDVYSFGVVLLELICGRPPIDPRHKYANIIDMVRPRVQAGDLEGIVDRSLRSDYSEESMWKVVEVAMTSVEPKEVHRPNMQSVVQDLREAVALEDQRCAKLGGTRQHAGQDEQGHTSSSASEIRSGGCSTSHTSHTSGASSGPDSLPFAR